MPASTACFHGDHYGACKDVTCTCPCHDPIADDDDFADPGPRVYITGVDAIPPDAFDGIDQDFDP